MPEPPEPLQRHALALARGHDRVLVVDVDHEVRPAAIPRVAGRRAARAARRGAAGSACASGARGGRSAPERDQLGQRELLEHRRPARARLGLEHRLDQRAREHEPRQPQPGRERLARGAGVDDVLGIEALERARGLAVVAELAVVVVLDHDRPALARPGHERRPAGGRERRAERELVGGGEQRGVGLDRLRAVLVDRHRHDPPRRPRARSRGGGAGTGPPSPASPPSSAASSSASASLKPAQTTIRSGSASTPRARPR